MELQLAKAEQVVRMWGVPERRLRAWLDTGIVSAAKLGRRGRGSFRLLTDASLADAFLAARLSHDLAPARVRRCLQAARPHYADLVMIDGPRQVIFELKHTQHEIHVAIIMDQFQRTLEWLRHTPEATGITRGRRPKRWQNEFAQLLTGIGEDVQAGETRLPPLSETIREYRASRRRGGKDLRVTVPT